MRGTKFAVALIIGIGTLLAGFGAARSHRQGDDDHAIISQITTMKQRREFFRTLAPERKSALWRKHYATEVSKHPELTADQKAVIDLAMVIASPDLFRDNLPEPCSPGSVFRTTAENAFKDSLELRREIFGQPADPLPKFAHTKNTQDEQFPDCECNRASWCNSCSCLQCQYKGSFICVQHDSGCGCFWQSACESMCDSCF